MGSFWFRKTFFISLLFLTLGFLLAEPVLANPEVKIGLTTRQTNAEFSVNRGIYFLEFSMSKESAILKEAERVSLRSEQRNESTYSVVIGPYAYLGFYPYENEEGVIKALSKIRDLGYQGNIIAFSSIPSYVIEVGRFQDILEAEIFRLHLESHFPRSVVLPTLKRGLVIKHPELEVYYPFFDNIALDRIISLKPFGHGLLNYNNRTYRGNVNIIWSPSLEDFQVINELPAEDYLLGVVPNEMPDSFNIEALRAQAIAARTYVLRNIGRFSSEGFDLCPTANSQVYNGFSSERTNSNRAVNDTSGMVLQFNGNLAQSFYHSTSGGRTENVENVWGGSAIPYLISVISQHETSSPHFEWQMTLTQAQVTDRVNQLLTTRRLANIGTVRDIQILTRGVSPRIINARLVGSLRNTEVSGGFLRTAFGLRETWAYFEFDGGPSRKVFTINKAGQIIETRLGDILDFSLFGTDQNIIVRSLNSQINIPISWQNVTISGKGWGHGVGMSQWGAQGYAQNGWNYERILFHFYPGTALGKLY